MAHSLTHLIFGAAVLACCVSPLACGKEQARPTEADLANTRLLLLEWESQQHMEWRITLTLEDNTFGEVLASGRDTGESSGYRLSEDKRTLLLMSATSWDQGGAIFKLADGARGRVTVSLSDPYVKDRLTGGTFALADLAAGTKELVVRSEQYRIRNALFRMSMAPTDVARAQTLLAAIGKDRRANIQTLLAAAEATEGERRVKLLFRAAAACTGGCNHGPLEPDGWDKAIAIYERIMSEYAGTRHAINAQWVRASCHGAWSQWGGCDAGGIGKGDWARAVALYDELFAQMPDPGSKAEALRRKAELQCSYANDLPGGLATYRKLLAEFPESVAKPPYRTSDYWTYRTCEVRLSIQDIRELLGMSDIGELMFAGSVSADRTSGVQPLASRGGCRIHAKEGFVRLTCGHSDTKSAGTVTEYSPPFKLTARVRTDSTNIRLQYEPGWAIFNWEADKTKLMVGDFLEPKEHEVPGKGYLAINEWHDIVWEIDADAARLYANGKLLYTYKGDLSKLHGPVGIGPAWGSTVDVATFIVERRGP
ncbi:MAG: tetratricopeptide repeat protein [Planctomycetota bacterium]